LIATFVASAAVAGAAGAAHGAFEGANGDVAFDRAFRIWHKAPNLTATEHKLREDGASDSAAAYSPDGSRVVFVRNAPGPELFVTAADGSGSPRRLTTNSVVESDPEWSPDGTRIVYERGPEIWSVRADGTAPQELTAPGVGDSPEYDPEQPSYGPAWSPRLPGAADGVIAFIHKGVLWTMTSRGDAKAPLAHSCPTDNGICDPSEAQPAWAPDGGRLSFTYLGDIYVLDLGDGVARPLAATADGTFPGAQTASTWSPDGLRVLFASAAPAASDNVAFARSDLTSRRPALLTDTAAPETNPTWQPRPICDNEDATAGPDVITGSPGAETLCGLGGDDIIDGAGGNDLVLGGGGRDRVMGGRGNDTLDGGAGADLGDFGGATAGIRASLATEFATGEGLDVLLSLERIEGSPFADVLRGADTANVLLGGAGEDLLDVRDGIAGNDRIVGGAQTDRCPRDPGDAATSCP
jgi:hypothetical protein